MASETTAAPEPIKDIDFDGGDAPEGTVWVKWDVNNGRDRTHEPYVGNVYQLEGTPEIQGVEIKSGSRVSLLCWTSSYPNGNPALVVDGPTNGKHKVNKIRLGCYRVDPR
ncbi:hypothetical protein VFPPC_15262 [Pochonia chlamydosporia 170]|uniref:Uncharacterized protein n=1 Tax=Pochonia chlamydosporia 170 TaxID=1380566 RepID=A0A179G6K7_METCM|nr:hypothetical protein VFPPC_15262 [Pochonia chlamydosporia 170]OAQ73150.1 hypothetical protein VFPPC_15262 [Pochonia chlamydosporia 170]